MTVRDSLARLLSDGEFYSGSVLGEKLGISRAAIHKHIRALQRSGLPIDGVSGRGYRLQPGVSLLDAKAILQHLSPQTKSDVHAVHVVPHTVSTNRYLQELETDAGGIHGVVCLAEAQTSGRGRRGNRWIASAYRNMMLSIGWRYITWPTDITAIGIVAAITMLDVFVKLGIPDVQIKWPNDLVWRGHKLGGILIDVNGESTGPCTIIVGIGVNVHISDEDGETIDQPWIDMEQILDAYVDRNVLAAVSIDAVVSILTSYSVTGFGPYRKLWAKQDVVAGQSVAVKTHGTSAVLYGQVMGINEAGALRVRDQHGVETICYEGDVSVRSV